MILEIYTALKNEPHGADAARVKNIVTGVMAGMEELVELHNVQDDRMFIPAFLQEANRSMTQFEDDVLAHDILTVVSQVMENLAEEIDAALAVLPAVDEEQVRRSTL